MPPTRRKRTTNPHVVDARKHAAAQEPISLRARISTLEVTNGRLQNELQVAEARADKRWSKRYDDLVTINLKLESDWRTVPLLAAEAARKSVADALEPMLGSHGDELNDMCQRLTAACNEVRLERDALLDSVTSLRQEADAAKTLAAAAVEENSRAKAELADICREGMAPPWMLRLAKAVAESPAGKSKDAVASEFFRRCMRFAAEQIRKALPDVKQALRVDRVTAAKADDFAAGANAEAVPLTDEQRAVRRAKAQAIGVLVEDETREDWLAVWVSNGEVVDREVLSGSPSMVAEALAKAIGIEGQRDLHVVIEAPRASAGAIMVECLSATFGHSAAQVTVEAFDTTDRTFPPPQCLLKPGCCNRMHETGECDNTATAERDGGLAVCPALKPGFRDGHETPPDGCEWYEWLKSEEATDAQDVADATEALAEIDAHPETVVTGEALEKKLAAMDRDVALAEQRSMEAQKELSVIKRAKAAILWVAVSGPDSFTLAWTAEGERGRLDEQTIESVSLAEAVGRIGHETYKDNIKLVVVETTYMGAMLLEELKRYNGAKAEMMIGCAVTRVAREAAKNRIVDCKIVGGKIETITEPVENPDDIDVLIAAMIDRPLRGRGQEIATAHTDDGVEEHNDSDGPECAQCASCQECPDGAAEVEANQPTPCDECPSTADRCIECDDSTGAKQRTADEQHQEGVTP